MKLALATALTTLLTSAPAMAFELYHCTVYPAADGYFGSIDLKVDGSKVTVRTLVAGHDSEIAGDASAYFYKSGDGREILVVEHQEGRELTENVSFDLKQVVAKAGTGIRYTAKEGFGSSESQVSVTCEMATPI